MLVVSISSIYVIVNILYFANLIPPIPLSLKSAGVYHSLTRNKTGTYVAQAEKKSWLDYFSFHDTFHEAANDSIYAYSAVFSPAEFNLGIVHEWQKFDGASGQWITINRVNLSVSGGRENGYRTYSVKNNFTPGQWRINVKTSDDKIIGQLRFDVTQVDTEPALITEVLN